MNGFLRIHPDDSVAVALRDIAPGEIAEVGMVSIIAQEPIPCGHKMALRTISLGEPVIKYGASIGYAKKDVPCGFHVHSHNMETGLLGVQTYCYTPAPHSKRTINDSESFFGYRRSDGRVGTRNEIWILPLVSCVNKLCQELAALAEREMSEGIDGIYAFPHNAGCSQLGDDFEMTQQILASIVRHPNAGGVLLVSLGCENNDFAHFLPVLGEIDTARIKTMVAQEVEGDERERGLMLIREIAETVRHDRREMVSVANLCIGFKCGGSDAFSGITANPLCGSIADHITDLGGSCLLTEVPEMFGAESYLMARADCEQTFHKIVRMINETKDYYLSHGQPIYENPSPGNKAGGITTLEEKSLGCIQKGGTALVVDTLAMGQRFVKRGLNLVYGPGNDSVSVTNLLAAGAQIILFTTGRGNPLSTAVPTLKISSNTSLAIRKSTWIDFDAGVLLNGADYSYLAQALWKKVLETASGEKTKAEERGYKEIMIFKNGVML